MAYKIPNKQDKKKYSKIINLEEKRFKITLQQRKIAKTIKNKPYQDIAVNFINTH